MEHTLEFLNPTFHRGDNVTIRNGRKWIEKAFSGQIVKVVRTGETEALAQGVVKDIRLIPFKGVTLQDLWEEHDPECRTPDGLTKAMLMAYPDFNLESEVTIIRFTID